ncbi:hypothetical protein [Nocardioides alkalitolerans]|uniref:hypothetical protein n=1 Tax=Nocardioides alkalitolerans TaxID=281714 RepID=UPI0003F56D88|nr:hypothetical protein [Nocardioides alkalitolerans]
MTNQTVPTGGGGPGGPTLVFERRTGWTGDPFWDEVRRRCPDLPIVLLPPEPPPASSGTAPLDPVGDDELLGAVRNTGVLATALLRTAFADETRPEVTARLRPTTGGATVLASTAVRDEPDAAEALDRLAAWLGAPGRGWRSDDVDGPVRVLTAARGPLTVVARHHAETGTLVLDVRHGRLPATSAQVRRLRAALREHAVTTGGDDR